MPWRAVVAASVAAVGAGCATVGGAFDADGKLASYSSSTTAYRIGPMGTVTPEN